MCVAHLKQSTCGEECSFQVSFTQVDLIYIIYLYLAVLTFPATVMCFFKKRKELDYLLWLVSWSDGSFQAVLKKVVYKGHGMFGGWCI